MSGDRKVNQQADKFMASLDRDPLGPKTVSQSHLKSANPPKDSDFAGHPPAKIEVVGPNVVVAKGIPEPLGTARSGSTGEKSDYTATEQPHSVLETVQHTVGDTLLHAKESLSQTYEATIHKVSDTIEAAKHLVGMSTDQAMDAASSTAQQASRTVQQTYDTAKDTTQRAAGTTTGILGGVVETITHAKDKAIDTIAGTLHGVVEGTRDVTSHTLESAKSTVGVAKDTLYHGVETAENAGFAAVEKARDTAYTAYETVASGVQHTGEVAMTYAHTAAEQTSAAMEKGKQAMAGVLPADASLSHVTEQLKHVSLMPKFMHLGGIPNPPPLPSSEWSSKWGTTHKSFNFDSFRWDAARTAQHMWRGESWVGDDTQSPSGGWQEYHRPSHHHRALLRLRPVPRQYQGTPASRIPSPPPLPTQKMLDDLWIRKRGSSGLSSEFQIPADKISPVQPGHSFADAVKDNLGGQQQAQQLTGGGRA